VDSLQQKLMEQVDGILAVHEFHIWQLAGDRIIASAHVRCLNLAQYMTVAERVKEFFHNEGIHSTTIQPEFVETSEPTGSISSTDDCMLSCPKTRPTEQGCDASKCCPSTMGPKLGSSGQLPESSPSEARLRRPSSAVSISGVNMGGLGQGSSRRSAPDLALLPDTVQLQLETKQQSILKSRPRSTEISPPSSAAVYSPRTIFDHPGDLPSLEGSEDGESEPMVAKGKRVSVVSKQSNV